MDVSWARFLFFLFVAGSLDVLGVRGEEAITFTGNIKQLSWTSASDRCDAINKRLCLRKDLCRKIASGNVPRKNVEIPRKDTWVPVSDEYNDWMYIGPKRIRQCDKLSDTDGPPSWGKENCTNWNTRILNRKIKVFCAAANGFFCCRKNDVLQKPEAHPVAIYVNSRKDKGIPYYSFSLEESRNKSDWFVDRASWRESGRLPGDVKKFTLMSDFVENEFEHPIFFCIRTITTKAKLLTTLHRISKRWCGYPWKTNFYLYGSYSVPSDEPFEKLIIGTKGTGLDMHSRISIKDNKEFPKRYFLYVPSNKKTHQPYIQPTNQGEDACDGQVEILTARSGIISSPGYPNKFTANEKKNHLCNWKIVAERGSVIRISFRVMRLANEMRLEHPTWKFRNFEGGRTFSYNFDMNCLKDKVEVAGYGIFCGNKLPPTFVTIDNEIDISFVGKKHGSGTSFSLYYEFVKPPNDLTMTRISEEKLQYFTWSSANNTCAIQGKTLCKSQDICSFGSRPFYGVMQGDQWAPILDEYNDWIQIGRGNVETCGRHNRIHGPPQWGVEERNCHGANMSRPCPTRQILYCCDSTSDADAKSNKLITVLIYSTMQNGNIFFKYLREGTDDETDFDSDKIWSPGRKKRGDITSIRLYSDYSPGAERVVYFCSKKIVPAIGKLKTAYTMSIQPCETKGWKLLYYLYTSNKQQNGTTVVNVGISERRPYHSRPHLEVFPDNFQGDESFIIYGFGPTKSQDEVIDINDEDSACSGNTSVIVAPSVLESPGYPTSYKSNSACKWIIKLPKSEQEKGNRLKIIIEELNLEDPVDILSVYDIASVADLSKATIVDDNDGLYKARRDFTGMVNQVTMESDGAFLLVFKSDATVHNKGFRIKAEIISNECGGRITKNGDIITSPNYPTPYLGGTTCTWAIRRPSKDYSVELQFQNFDLLASKDCSDNVSVTEQDFLAYSFCGGDTPSDILKFDENHLNITFNTQPRPSSKPVKGGKGFSLKVTFVPKDDIELEEDNSKPQCGIQSVPISTGDPATDRIVDGKKAAKGNFPWVVQIKKPRLSCGGSLINDKWVLTATHCFVAQFIRSLGIMLLHEDLNTYVVIAGRYDRSRPSPGEQQFNVTELMIHGGFTRYSARWRYRSGMSILGIFPYNDIALAKLSRKAVFTPTVSPVCLPTQDAHVGDFCYVAGWGSREADKVDMVSVLNYAKVPILDNSLCNSWKEMKGTIMEKALCAGYPEGGNDHCWGDSGGPLMCRGQYGNFYINGIVSWSRECGKKRMPGIYTRVWKYRDWISKVISM